MPIAVNDANNLVCLLQRPMRILEEESAEEESTSKAANEEIWLDAVSKVVPGITQTDLNRILQDVAAAKDMTKQ